MDILLPAEQRLEHGLPIPICSIGSRLRRALGSSANHVLNEACREWTVYRMMSHGWILDYVSRGSRSYSVSDIEIFAELYICGKGAQRLADTELVRQEHPRHTVDSVSWSETFARSFGRQT